jgi:hypothetical protein
LEDPSFEGLRGGRERGRRKRKRKEEEKEKGES